MKDALASSEVFRGLSDETIAKAVAIAGRRTLETGEHAFLLGQEAENLYVVLQGAVDLCVPISIDGAMREVTIETKPVGSAIGWSAFVKPRRFRLSAKAAEPTELAVLSHDALHDVLTTDQRVGWRFMERIAELIAERLLTVQALWARELQRFLLGGGPLPADS